MNELLIDLTLMRGDHMTDAQRYQMDRDDAILHHWRKVLEDDHKMMRTLAHYEGLVKELKEQQR